MSKGDCNGYVALLSDRDDVTWGYPFGPFARGREGVQATLASAAARMQGGKATGFDLGRSTALVDGSGHALPVNDAVLERLEDPRV